MSRRDRAPDRIRLGRSPTIAEIADGAEDDAGGGARGDGSRLRLLDRLAVDRAGRRRDELDPLETIGDEDAGFERSEDRAALEPALERLPEREREILRMRFEEGLPQTQIAERVGLSQMHVSRLIRKSLAVMREELLR